MNPNSLRQMNLADLSQLVVIDVQVRLAAAMAAADRTRVIRQAGLLGRAAGLLDIPVTVTEQYPKGLGHTEPDLLAALPPTRQVVEKLSFSCCAEAPFGTRLLEHARRQIVVCGMETHVCVLQTVLDLLGQYDVFVVEDAVSSRTEANRRNAIERMRGAGAVITSAESVLFEWLRHAGHAQFKTISGWLR